MVGFLKSVLNCRAHHESRYEIMQKIEAGLKIVIIIPTYNEAGSIKKTLVLLQEMIATLPEHSMTILVYDSHSNDETVAIVSTIQKRYKNIILLQEGKKTGLGSAYIKGMKYVIEHLGADVVFEFDADGSHQPCYIPDMIRQIENGADVVMGSRYIKDGKIDADWAWNRRIISRLGNSVARLLLSWKFKDITSGFRATKISFLKKINLDELLSKNYAYKIHLFWILLQSGANIKEIPITFLDREQGISKFPKNNMIESLRVVVTLRWRKLIENL